MNNIIKCPICSDPYVENDRGVCLDCLRRAEEKEIGQKTQQEKTNRDLEQLALAVAALKKTSRGSRRRRESDPYESIANWFDKLSNRWGWP